LEHQKREQNNINSGKGSELESNTSSPTDFIRTIIAEDLKTNKHHGKVITRFPPEPNGYLHIGHAKSICINFGIAAENKAGVCHLRFDDTNPCKEDIEYEEAIQRDVRWLGFDWGNNLFYASDYYDRLYHYAVELIKKGKAYVCSLSADEIREYRGTLTKPGKDSPYRMRSVEENLDLFEKMKAGAFEGGGHVLRAKIDMASPNMNMRDPAIYRILKTAHNRTGNKWCIYPMYDFAHCLSDSIEGITHSICTLEFEDHRPPGWDDPRMPTLAGMRRRGYTPESIRNFCDRIGVAKANSMVDIALLNYHLREELNRTAQRSMVVLRPLKVVITNYPEGQVEELDGENNPEDPGAGSRKIPFSRVIYIEQDDFREEAPKKYFRLAPGREVRLKHAYYIKCEEVIKDEKTGEIKELHCTYDPATKGGWSKDGRKVKGTLHWVSAQHAVAAEVRLYDHLFTEENPESGKEGDNFKSYLNPNSLETLTSCLMEPNLVEAKPGNRYQFLRQGYFCVDSVDSTAEKLVFNRIVPLRDSWAKVEKKTKKT
jgi:glutaminyl-tRNA synthetase